MNLENILKKLALIEANAEEAKSGVRALRELIQKDMGAKGGVKKEPKSIISPLEMAKIIAHKNKNITYKKAL